MSDARPCGCGSGLPSTWAVDARGIELARVCPRCEETILARYRPEILFDGDCDLDEDVDPDNGFGFGLLDDEVIAAGRRMFDQRGDDEEDE